MYFFSSMVFVDFSLWQGAMLGSEAFPVQPLPSRDLESMVGSVVVPKIPALLYAHPMRSLRLVHMM